jgi:hypothetical protein
MSRVSPLRIVLFGGLVGFFALVSAQCKARTYLTCTGLCESALPCNYTFAQCMTFCTNVQDRCEAVGRPAVFQAFVACASDAGFSCNYPDGGDGGDAGDAHTLEQEFDGGEGGPTMPAVASASCGIQQAELIQCESFDGEMPLDVIEGSYDPAFACPDAASCVACCEAAYPTGAKEFREAVQACVCADSGVQARVCLCVADGSNSTHPCTPAQACASEVCASHPMLPTAGDDCDQCVTTLLNEQSIEAGACVGFVNRRCSYEGAKTDASHAECAFYANCVSQSGCTN